MKNSSKLYVLLISMTLIFIVGCDNSSSSKGGVKLGAPVLNEQNLNRNGCFNVEALQTLFNSESMASSAIEVTSDFKPDNDLNRTKALFHTHAAFDVRDLQTTNIFVLNRPTQADCTTVTAQTVSGEILNFNITKSSPKSISLSLQKKDDAGIPSYRKDALEKRFHPIRYDIEIMDSNHLRVVTTYRTFDAHCRTKNKAISTIQKDYYWSTFGKDLPSEVLISQSFYDNYLSTIQGESIPTPPQQPNPNPEEPILEPTPEPVPEVPVPETPENPVLPPPGADAPQGYISVNVADLKNLKNRVVKEDLIKCGY